jgi:transglutaminase-like putative cysteine protease
MLRLRTYSPPASRPDRNAANLLLLSAAMAIAIHVIRIPAWLMLVTACLLLWRFCIDNLGWRVPGRLLRALLAMVMVIAVYGHYGTLLGRDAGSAFLVGLVGLKLIEIRQVRDYYIGVFLLYFLTLGGFLFSQSLLLAFYAVAVTTTTTITLFLLNRPVGYGPRQTLRLFGVMVLTAVPLMLVMYLMFPRIQGSLWGLPDDAFDARTGLSDEVAPGSVNRLLNNDRVAFRVHFDDSPPPPAQQYWRVMVLSEIDGRRWRRHVGSGDGKAAGSFTPLGNGVGYQVVLEPTNQTWLAAMDLPGTVPDLAVARPGHTLAARSPLRQRESYSLRSFPQYVTGALRVDQLKHNLAWPVPPSERVRALATELRRLARNPEEIVELALAHFNEQAFRYTLSPPSLGRDPLDEFLFETRAGYCEHYAHALAALLRLSGVPARLVVGFQGGEWNPVGGYMIVRMSDAHAWTEAWLPQRGWQRVDATAAVAPERIEFGVEGLRELYRAEADQENLSREEMQRLLAPQWWKRALREAWMRWDAVNDAWNRWVMAYGPEKQRRFLRAIGFSTPTWAQAVISMVAASALVGLLAAVFILGRHEPRDRLAAVYRRFCHKLARCGLQRAANEGPLDFQRRVITRRPDLAHPVAQITAIYTGMRYGRDGTEHLPKLKRLVGKFAP